VIGYWLSDIPSDPFLDFCVLNKFPLTLNSHPSGELCTRQELVWQDFLKPKLLVWQCQVKTGRRLKPVNRTLTESVVQNSIKYLWLNLWLNSMKRWAAKRAFRGKSTDRSARLPTLQGFRTTESAKGEDEKIQIITVYNITQLFWTSFEPEVCAILAFFIEAGKILLMCFEAECPLPYLPI
jgi:hypothetical protein